MKVEQIEHEEARAAYDGAGARLCEARVNADIPLARIAGDTRIPLRHLEAIERGDFDALPARTYAVGFSRTYAREVGLDEDAVVADIRAELGEEGLRRTAPTDRFEPGDPARVPSRGLAWAMALAALLLLVGGFMFYRAYFLPGADLPPLEREGEAIAAAPQAGAARVATPAAAGPVVFTALEDNVWVRFYEADGERLLEKQMARGERFTVPPTARDPQIWTGRPDAFAITVGGRRVPRLAEDDFIMRDQAIDAEALLSRGNDTADAGSDVT